MTTTTALYNLQDAAALVGVTPQTLKTWVGHGCPVAQKGNGKRTAWQFSIPDVIRWREQVAAEKASGGVNSTMDDARLRRANADAALAELQLLRESGEVVTIEEVVRQVGDQLSAVRAKMLAIPTASATLLATMSDPRECRDCTDQFIREALEELTGYSSTRSSDEELELDGLKPVPEPSAGRRSGREAPTPEPPPSL
jgi:phage terminase Nu1 subunit (DNA packaging protein)